EAFVERETEIEQENVLGVSQGSIVRSCEIGKIGELNSQPVGYHVTDAGAEAQLGDVVCVELVKRFSTGQCEPRFWLPCALVRGEWNVHFEEAADAAGLVPIVGGEVLDVPVLVSSEIEKVQLGLVRNKEFYPEDGT